MPLVHRPDRARSRNKNLDRRLITTWRSIHSQLLLWLAALHQTHAESARVREITLAAHRRLVKIMVGGDAERARAMALEQLMHWRPPTR